MVIKANTWFKLVYYLKRKTKVNSQFNKLERVVLLKYKIKSNWINYKKVKMIEKYSIYTFKGLTYQ